MLTDDALYDGGNHPPQERYVLAAGALSLQFVSGELRTIRLGKREVLRRIYVAVRDQQWRTIPAEISHLHVDARPDWFHVAFDARHRWGDIDFCWAAQISGDAHGTIRFAMEGRALVSFLRNRIGLCVLHPIDECAGRPCVVEHSDGSLEEGKFPRFISPHQPFKDIKALAHTVQAGLRAEVRFEGDIFEMEDQRNWTDVSFKTYSTPLDLPFPVMIAAGEQVRQSVTLSWVGQPPAHPAHKSREIELSVDGQSGPLPRLGLSTSGQGRPLSEREVHRLRALHLSHLRVDLYPGRSGAAAVLRSAAGQARAVGVPLEVALFLGQAPGADLHTLADMLHEVQPSLGHWLVLSADEATTPEDAARLARPMLLAYSTSAAVGSGTNGDFTAINRTHPPLQDIDMVCYSVNPQCHAFDNDVLFENAEGQGLTIESARHFCGRLPLAIGPITLRPRPRTPLVDAPTTAGAIPDHVDRRQMSLVGAAWTAASLRQMAEHGAHSATYFETAGWLGVMEREEGCDRPGLFPSIAGSVFPLYHVLADVGEFAGGSTLATMSSHKLVATGMAMRRGDRLRILLANMTGDEHQITVRGLPEAVRVRLLDETTALAAITAPETFRRRRGVNCTTTGGSLGVLLRPYAVARIDG